MIKFNMKITGIEKLERGLKDFSKNLLPAVDKASFRMAHDMRNYIISQMRATPKLGRAYRRSKTGAFHHPSKPFNFPAIDSGKFSSSALQVDKQRRGIEVGAVERVGGMEFKYPKYLEEGTSNMEARPWAEPTFEKFKKETEFRVMRELTARFG